MERDEDGKWSANATANVIALMSKQPLREHLMHSQGNAVHASPDDEVEACTMPKTTKQHGDDKVEKLTNLAFAVATQ